MLVVNETNECECGLATEVFYVLCLLGVPHSTLASFLASQFCFVFVSSWVEI